MEYEFSVQFRGNTLTVISAEVGAEAEAVLSFARDAHYVRFRRLCTDVRLACAEERPVRWMKNPIPSALGELWMVVVVWEEGFPAVAEMGQAQGLPVQNEVRDE